MINQRKLLFFFLLTVFYNVSAQGSDIFFTNGESAWLSEHNTIKIAGPRAFPPFHYIEEKTAKGMASDYALIISQKLGIKMVLDFQSSWPEILKKTKTHQIDVITCAAKTPDREKYLNFTTPYLSFPMVIISKKQAPFIGGLKDLHGKTVACIKKISSCEWLSQDKIRFTPYSVNSPLEGLEAVSLGRADVYLGNLAASSYLIDKKGLVNLKIAAPTSYGNYNLAFAVRKDWPEMVSIINKALESITPEEHSQIRQKWIAVRYEHGIDSAQVRKITLQIIGISIFVILIIFLWNRQIWRREERFRCLTENGTDLIQAFNQDGTIVYQSPSHAAILGYKADELIESCLFDLFHEDEQDAWQKTFKEILKGKKSHPFEHRICHKQGHFLFFESNFVNLLKNRALNAIVMNARDTTLRRQNRNELKLAKEAAEAANKAKSTFLANMSHELRTPLNAVLGFAQLMRQSNGLTKDQVDNTNIIIKSGTHLLNLINDVLDMSKIEAGRTSLRQDFFDLWLMLDDLEDMLRLRAQDKELQLIFERKSNCPRYICTDEAKLRQILINLLNNALKFTKQGCVTLRAGIWNNNCSKEIMPEPDIFISDNSKSDNPDSEIVGLSFEIEDTGTGIPGDKIKRIFEPFFQTRPGDQSEEGTGLGLPISKKFVQLMGGDLNLCTKMGQGTVFRFYIMARLADQENIQHKKKTPKIISLKKGQPKFRILIVDDRWDNRQLMVKLLGPLGFSLQEAENGLQAVNIWKEWEPHLIWMDMRMPVMDGYEAAEKIKSSIKGQATAIIALTASALDDERSVVLSVGCNDFLRKPFRQSEIFSLMQKHIGVQYEYADQPDEDNQGEYNQNEPEENNLYSISFAKLPSELITNLERAAIEGDMTAMDNLVEDIRFYDEKTADSLAELAEGFEYSKILLHLKNETPRAEKQ
ncbi:transporter substrate-binding domain-containing protein [Desulfobacterales bacterium HSG17]|nr:transporter substrate-binding domain-containing protein [Desulfobacterales bacterium HSG17]